MKNQNMKRIVLCVFILTVGVFLFGQGNEIHVHADDAQKPETPPNKESDRDSDFFTLIVLPDTQGYADIRHKETQKHWPDIGDQRSCFYKQTEWIKEEQAEAKHRHGGCMLETSLRQITMKNGR